MAFVQRSGGGHSPKVMPWSEQGDAWARRYPALAEYLDADKFPDGSARKTSTLLVFVDDGVLKACVSDRAESRVAFFSASTFEGLLDAVEVGLSTDNADWRPAGGGGRKRR